MSEVKESVDALKIFKKKKNQYNNKSENELTIEDISRANEKRPIHANEGRKN